MKQFRNSRYWVSEDGKVFRLFPKKEYINNKGYITQFYPDRYKERKQQIVKGRPYVVLNIGVRTRFLVYRLVAELYVPGYFEGAVVDHIDNNPLNSHYTNLQWCTQEYNVIKGISSTFPLYSEWNK
jgi:hypothetical protein